MVTKVAQKEKILKCFSIHFFVENFFLLLILITPYPQKFLLHVLDAMINYNCY